MTESDRALVRPRGRNTAGRKGKMARRKTEGTDQAAPGTERRTDGVAANRLTEREDVGAAAQATEKGEGMRGGGVEVAREENGASLEGEERGAGVFLGRGGGDELFKEEKINFCCTQPTKLLHTILQSCVEVSENKLLLEHTCC